MKGTIKLSGFLIIYELAAGCLMSALCGVYPGIWGCWTRLAVMLAFNAVLFYRILPKRAKDEQCRYTVLGFFIAFSALSAVPFIIRIFYIAEYPAPVNHIINTPIWMTFPLSQGVMKLFETGKNVSVMTGVFIVLLSLNLSVNLLNYTLFKKGCFRCRKQPLI